MKATINIDLAVRQTALELWADNLAEILNGFYRDYQNKATSESARAELDTRLRPWWARAPNSIKVEFGNMRVLMGTSRRELFIELIERKHRRRQ